MTCFPQAKKIPGKYNLVVWHSNGIAFVNGIGIDGKEKVLDIKFDKGFKVSGKILLDSGKPADMAMVVAVNENDMPVANSSVNSDDGSYTLEVLLPKGKYRLFAIMKEYSVEAMELEVNSDMKLDAVLCKAGSARLKIKDPVRTEKLTLKTSDGKIALRLGKFSPSYRSLCDLGICLNNPGGETAVSGLRPGDYTLTYDDSGKQIKFTVKTLEESTVEIK